jgi:DNA-binding response OmpR family regulator
MSDVLIIDDDPTAAGALAALLRRDGHEAACACDAGQALAYLRRHEPSLVLLDLEMPRTGGLDLLDALRDEPRFAALRIAIFSGSDDPCAQELAAELGACDFIEKGQDWSATRDRIRRILAASDV